MTMKLIYPKALILDMDGVLYQGNNAIDEAINFINNIKIPKCFITNNPTLLAGDIASKLSKMGYFNISKDSIITSGVATANYLQQLKPNYHYYAVGAEALHQTLAQYGTADNKNADFVVVGEGIGLSHESLTIGINLILQNKAQLISTNPDTTLDGSCGQKPCTFPGGGALVAPFEVATASKAITIGKPHPLLYKMALQQLNQPHHHCLMIGDRPDTDIAGASALGIQTALVRTGRFKPEDPLPLSIKPDYDIESLSELSLLLSKI
ncbi:MAG: HAD-IIA family hydrolase [Thiotrichaceae bacterium]|nr:HAD-IIA family hydrolase [Thiotrichaceae bacterium]